MRVGSVGQLGRAVDPSLQCRRDPAGAAGLSRGWPASKRPGGSPYPHRRFDLRERRPTSAVAPASWPPTRRSRRGVRIRLRLLMVFLLLPIRPDPDFISVLGTPDDAVIAAIAVRSIARTAGIESTDPGAPRP